MLVHIPRKKGGDHSRTSRSKRGDREEKGKERKPILRDTRPTLSHHHHFVVGHNAWSLTPALFALHIVGSLTPKLCTASYLGHYRVPGATR